MAGFPAGRRAGQINTPANGRAKVRLSGIDWAMLEKVRQVPDGCLVARYKATSPSGAPAMATVPLLDGGWQPQRYGPSPSRPSEQILPPHPPTNN